MCVSLQAQLKNMTNCDRDLVAIGDCYFRLGLTIFSEIIRMLDDCAVFVVVLSKNYCFSDYCKHEIEQARLMRKPIVIIMKEFVDEDDMNGVIKETFKHFTRATFRFEEEGWRLEQDWEYICQSIIQLL